MRSAYVAPWRISDSHDRLANFPGSSKPFSGEQKNMEKRRYENPLAHWSNVDKAKWCHWRCKRMMPASVLEANTESRAPLTNSAYWACRRRPVMCSSSIFSSRLLSILNLTNNDWFGTEVQASLLRFNSSVYASSFATCLACWPGPPDVYIISVYIEYLRTLTSYTA